MQRVAWVSTSQVHMPPNSTTLAPSARVICAEGPWQEVEEGKRTEASNPTASSKTVQAFPMHRDRGGRWMRERGQRLQIPQHSVRPCKRPRRKFRHSRVDTVRKHRPHCVASNGSLHMFRGTFFYLEQISLNVTLTGSGRIRREV